MVPSDSIAQNLRALFVAMSYQRTGILLRPNRLFAVLSLVTLLAYLYWPWSGNRIYHGSGTSTIDPQMGARNSTLGIFVINRPSRTDRRDAMSLAAAVSGFKINYVDGVEGDSVPDRVLPPGNREKDKQWTPTKGSWRAHMNALQAVVEQGLPSALIMEDDVDWDARLKSQLETFGFGTSKWLQNAGASLKQNKNDEGSLLNMVPPLGKRGLIAAVPEQQILPNQVPRKIPSQNPYGEGWDVLWLGHCGSDFPKGPQPELRISILNDDTVPVPKHLKPHPFALSDPLGQAYPQHTRVIHAASGTVCTLAYAVSQKGAQKLLWQFGLESFTKQWDLMLSGWCEGKSGISPGTPLDSSRAADGNAVQMPICLTVQPPLISHNYEGAGKSDIKGQGGGFVGRTGCPYIRYSVRKNMPGLINGVGEDQLVDQWPDN